jgi:hypothetical protein
VQRPADDLLAARASGARQRHADLDATAGTQLRRPDAAADHSDASADAAAHYPVAAVDFSADDGAADAAADHDDLEDAEAGADDDHVNDALADRALAALRRPTSAASTPTCLFTGRSPASSAGTRSHRVSDDENIKRLDLIAVYPQRVDLECAQRVA